MNKREFISLVAAGCLFPGKLVKGLIGYPKSNIKTIQTTGGKIPERIRIISLGTDEEPATEEHIKKASKMFFMGRDMDADSLGCHYAEYWVHASYLILGVGSDKRPIAIEDLAKFEHDTIFRLRQGENFIITNHSIHAYYVQASLIENSVFERQVPFFPRIMDYRWALKANEYGFTRRAGFTIHFKALGR